MRPFARLCAIVAVCGAVATLLGSCAWLPQHSRSAEDLSGVWEFADADGVVSTMTIEPDGDFWIDRAPVEAFRLPDRLEDNDWDGSIAWSSAEPTVGVFLIGESGRVSFVTQEPSWGTAIAYENPFRQSLDFLVGDVDRGETISFLRVPNDP